MDHANAIARLIASVMNTYSDDKAFLPQALEQATDAYVSGMKKAVAAADEMPPTRSERLTERIALGLESLEKLAAMMERAMQREMSS